jgi:RES domain-containing protein
VLVWRIGVDTPDYSADDLIGEGARRTGGRWNRAGTAMVYTSGSISLACLETVVHLAVGDLPLNRYLVSIEVPDELWSAAIIFGPRDHVGWDAIPAGMVSLDAGRSWATAMTSALMLVPSVIVPEEVHILINPAHQDSGRIRAKKVRRWTYDARLR